MRACGRICAGTSDEPASLHHRITASPHHSITASQRRCTAPHGGGMRRLMGHPVRAPRGLSQLAHPPRNRRAHAPRPSIRPEPTACCPQSSTSLCLTVPRRAVDRRRPPAPSTCAVHLRPIAEQICARPPPRSRTQWRPQHHVTPLSLSRAAQYLTSTVYVPSPHTTFDMI